MKSIDLKNTISIRDAAKLLGITRQGAWKMWQHGKFKGRRWGSIIMLDRKSVEEYVKAYKRVKGGSDD